MIHKRILDVKKISISLGKDKIIKKVYYLHRSHIGIRVEVSNFTRTRTVEIKLVGGDDSLVKKKVMNYDVLSNPSEKEINAAVLKMISFAEVNGKI